MNNVNEFKVTYDKLLDETMNFSKVRKSHMNQAMMLLDYVANNRTEVNENYNANHLWNKLTNYLDSCIEYSCS